MTHDRRFEEACHTENEEEEGEIHNMCEVLDRIEKKGEQRGLRIGEQKGKNLERIRNIQNLMDTLNLMAQQAMDALRIPDGEREECLRKL